MWGSEELEREMLKEPNMYRLRRYRNDWKDRVSGNDES
jgi:hypothetical protein